MLKSIKRTGVFLSVFFVAVSCTVYPPMVYDLWKAVSTNSGPSFWYTLLGRKTGRNRA